MKKLHSNLLKVKQEIGKVSKVATNPFFKSKYMDLGALLEAVEPLLIENGLLLTQPIIDNQVCTVITNIEDGKEIISSLPLPPLTDPQKTGSCVTYYRRYTLKSLLAIQEEDDDGNKAAKPAPVKPEPTKPVPQFTPEQIADAKLKLNACKTLDKLKEVYTGIGDIAKNTEVIFKKDEMKSFLTK